MNSETKYLCDECSFTRRYNTRTLNATDSGNYTCFICEKTEFIGLELTQDITDNQRDKRLLRELIKTIRKERSNGAIDREEVFKKMHKFS